jgi:hypothetical protein
VIGRFTQPALRRAAKPLLVLPLLLLPAAACSGIGSSSPSTADTAAVQKFVAIKEATDNMSKLIELIATASGTSQQLAGKYTGTAAEKRLLAGSKIGWNNVLVGVNNFTQTQAKAVPGLTPTVLGVRRMAINWSNGLNNLNKGKSHLAAPQIKALQKQARSMKKPIERTVARLATDACTIEKANPGFVSDAALKIDCDNAATLTASAG